jgi:anti-sigma factor RsiW
MSKHVSPSDLEQYIIDGLDAVRAAAVEAHVARCEACGAALAKEATLEMAFEQVARAPVRVIARSREQGRLRLPLCAVAPSPSPLRGHRPKAPARLSLAIVTGGTLSLAAAWMLFLVPAMRGAPRAAGSRTSAERSGYSAVASDATTAAFDGRSPDPLDGG